MTRKNYPIHDASLLSKIFYCWALPLFYTRYKREYTEEQQYETLKSHESKKLGNKLEKLWRIECERGEKASLWHTLWILFWKRFIFLAALFIFFDLTLKMSQPWLVAKLMQSLQNNSIRDKYLYGLLIIATSFLGGLVNHTTLLAIHHLGMKARIACSSLIYRKILKMTTMAVAENTTGKIINLLSNDLSRIDFFVMYFLQLIVAPAETLFAFVCLYYSIGVLSASGIIFLICFIPVQLYMGKLAARYRSRTAQRTDQRVRLTNEVVTAIEVIKMYVWEKSFIELISKARQLEMHQIELGTYLKALNYSFMLLISRTGIFLSIATQVLLNGEINAEYVFVVTTIYSILRQTLTVYIPFGINNFSETRIAIDRVRKFLLSNEVNTIDKEVATYLDINNDGALIRTESTENIPVDKTESRSDRGCVYVENASTKWTKDGEYIVKNINFSSNLEELIIITGSVGSGKSTFLTSILNECPIVEGKIDIKGSISYASQVPWLFPGTIRENILFGSNYSKKRYEQILEITELKEDIRNFPNEDDTLVGDHGVLLSGGQKARINLARAVYREVDIYLLDDPFSALDINVSMAIFKKCILGFLKDKNVILTTNERQFWASAKHLYVIKNGNLKITTHEDFDEIECQDMSKIPHSNKAKTVSKKQEMKEEQKETGSVSCLVYRSYFSAGGDIFALSMLSLLFFLSQFAISGIDCSLGLWVNPNNDEFYFGPKIFTQLYMGAIIMSFFIIIFRSVFFFKVCVKASSKIHQEMLVNILKAPISFFNLRDSGQILNRFSKDMGIVDESLPSVIMETLQIALIALGSAVILSLMNAYMLLPTSITVILFLWFRKIFLYTSRNLKRTEATSKSPIFSHVSTTLQGLPTIRTFQNQCFLQSEFDRKQNLHTSAYYMYLTCSRAFAYWIDMICIIYTGIAIGGILLIDSPEGNVGLVITQSINLIGISQWGLRQWAEWENQMTSVERLIEYTNIKNEADVEETVKTVPKSWPETGKIEFNSLSIKYEDATVLTDATFTINSGEMIGIVGRTGVGKSSLISALFRLIDFDGQIKIDGISTKEIPLETLRSNISIIPQEPKLFNNTVRKNLDPLSEYQDSQVWKVLEDVKLKQHISELPKMLEDEILEGGVNFSVGQRQLICLARAMLKDNKILVLDEATSSIDHTTDLFIQQTIRSYFKGKTVLVVAHKMDTILDANRVLVLKSGQIVEFDEPKILLANINSEFSNLFNKCDD